MLLQNKNAVICGAGGAVRDEEGRSPITRTTTSGSRSPLSQVERAHAKRGCNRLRKRRTEGDNRMRQAGTQNEARTRRKVPSEE